MALLVDREHDGMGGRVDVEPDDVTQLGSEGRVGGELELPYPVRLQAVPAPDPLHGRDADGCGLGHGSRCPMRGLAGWLSLRQGHHARCDLRA